MRVFNSVLTPEQVINFWQLNLHHMRPERADLSRVYSDTRAIVQVGHSHKTHLVALEPQTVA